MNKKVIFANEALSLPVRMGDKLFTCAFTDRDNNFFSVKSVRDTWVHEIDTAG